MALRALLILAFLSQQIVLPAFGAHEAAACGATAEASVNEPVESVSCCTGATPADEPEPTQNCTCMPALCACDGEEPPAPAAPERTQRTIDHLVPLLTVSTAALPAPPRASGTFLPGEPVLGLPQHFRLQAVLCIWRT